MKTMMLIAALSLTGCTHTRLDYGGATFSRTQFASQVNFDTVELTTTNGTHVLLKGYTSDQVKALEAVAAGVAAGLAKGVRP